MSPTQSDTFDVEATAPSGAERQSQNTSPMEEIALQPMASQPMSMFLAFPKLKSFSLVPTSMSLHRALAATC